MQPVAPWIAKGVCHRPPLLNDPFGQFGDIKLRGEHLLGGPLAENPLLAVAGLCGCNDPKKSINSPALTAGVAEHLGGVSPLVAGDRICTFGPAPCELPHLSKSKPGDQSADLDLITLWADECWMPEPGDQTKSLSKSIG